MTSYIQPLDTPVPEYYDRDQPWHRQPFDTDEEWPAFRKYLQLPMPRSTVALARQLGLPRAKVMTWAREKAWLDRARAFDNYVDAHFNAVIEDTVNQSATDTAERHLKVLRMGLELAEDQLGKLIEASRSQHVHGLCTVNEVNKLLDTCIKLERLVMGDATEKVSFDLDLSKLDVSELVALESAQSKLKIEGSD